MPKEVSLESVLLPLVDVSLIIQFKACMLLAHSTQAWWWGCHIQPSSRLFFVGVVSASLWSSLFTTRQWVLLYWPQDGGLPLPPTSPYRKSPSPPALLLRTSPYPGKGPLHGTTSRASWTKVF